jgi:hypothetical protein
MLRPDEGLPFDPERPDEGHRAFEAETRSTHRCTRHAATIASALPCGQRSLRLHQILAY